MGKASRSGQQRLYEFYYLLPFDLWTSYLARILFLKGCGNLFWEYPTSTRIFNGLQYSFLSGKDSLMFQNPFLTRISYSSSLQQGKKTSDNSSFRSDSLVYLGLLKGDKSDSSIFRKVIFGFLLFFIIFFLVFGLLLLTWVNCKWASYKST